MKKNFLLFLFSCLSLLAIAQPSNDDCDGIIDLGQAPFQNYTEIYSNAGATPSNIGANNTPSCSPIIPQRDVWFTFTASDTITEYNVRVLATPDPAKGISGIYNPEFTIYRGPECGVDKLFEFACASSSVQGNPSRVSIDTLTLSPGSRYYVRVNDWSSSNVQPGGFKLYVTGLVKPITIADEVVNTECFGTIYDSGGPNKKYKNDEDYTYTICPTDVPGCIEFNLEYYSLQPSSEDFNAIDQLQFFDGPDTNAPKIAQIGKEGLEDSNRGVVSGGGVDYTVRASSGCLTVRFNSDSELSYEGFKGTWRCLPEDCSPEEPISITTDISEEVVIENIVRPSMEVTIDTIACSKESYGVFEAVSKELGLDKGIILSTGRAVNAIGPNKGIELDDGFIGTPGDPDLNNGAAADTIIFGGDTLLLGGETYDACALVMDVFTPTDEISFDYTVGSEEYAEFVGTSFNDVFAFLISGEGIVGNPEINNQENLAYLPNTQTEISINSVNMNNNWEYFRSNEFLGTGNRTSMSSLEYDGFIMDKYSKNGYLTASKKVIPCKKYRLKFVIADRSDMYFDSGAFISRVGAGSPSLDIAFSTGLDKFIENCTPETEYVELVIPGYATDTVTYQLTLSGTAMRGVDYEAEIPALVTFLPGETSKRFPLKVLADNEVEGTETIEIKLSKEYDCGTFDYQSLTINIQDAIAVSIGVEQDTISYCEGNEVELEASGGNHYRWLPENLFDDNLINPQTITPTGDQWIFVEGRTGICASLDSIYLKEEAFSLELVGEPVVCPGSDVNLTATSTTDNVAYEWKDADGNIVSQSNTISTTPTADQTYTLTATPAQGCDPKSTVINVGVYPDFQLSEITFTDVNGNAVEPNALLGANMIKASIMIDPELTGATINWYVNDNLVSTTSGSTSELIDLSSYIGSQELSFRAEVTDVNGCVKSLNESVSIENNVKVLIPNVFSPNGDNNNDRFRIVNKGTTGIDIISFKIYNRWGNLVYDNEDGADGWDGMYNGKAAPAETYIYKLSYRSQATLEVTSSVGEITILR